MAGCKMKDGGSAKGASGKAGAGMAPQEPAQFAAPKVVNGFKKGGLVKDAPKKVPADKNVGKVVAAAKPTMKKVDKTAKDATKAHFDNVKVMKSYASSGAAVKKLPMKLAMGGVAKLRRGFKNTLPMPKKPK